MAASGTVNSNCNVSFQTGWKPLTVNYVLIIANHKIIELAV